MTDLLQQIQQLQFDDRGRAEALLRDFIQSTFPILHVETVILRPQAVSLNSFNGFLTLQNGQRLFFKTHTEQDNVIDEYYNAKLLADAGYPVIQPVYSSNQAGQHLLIYDVIESPSVFDVAWAIEQGENTRDFDALYLAQNDADRMLYDLYVNTLDWQSEHDARKTPIHQLFIHRLIGGRLQRFYADDVEIMLPDARYLMGALKNKRWLINGQAYEQTLHMLIEHISGDILSFEKLHGGIPSIIGHGDAHNGNVFFRNNNEPPNLLYFDPAFAGRHHPLLDLAKPVFHNVFAMWMYFPEAKRADTKITLHDKTDVLQVEYHYELPEIRHMFLNSKIDNVLVPILRELKHRDWLMANWREYFKAALFCCPLLTLNLADSTRFSPEISLLGLAMAVEMGAKSHGQRSLIDAKLDEVGRML